MNATHRWEFLRGAIGLPGKCITGLDCWAVSNLGLKLAVNKHNSKRTLKLAAPRITCHLCFTFDKY